MLPPQQRPVVPPWVARLGAVSWRLLVVIALGAVLASIAFTISTVSATILISLVVAATFAPLVLALRRRGWPNALAAAAVTGSAVLILGAIVVLVGLAFAPHVAEIVQGISSGIAQAKSSVASAGLSTDAVDAVDVAARQAEQWISANVNAL